MLINEPVQSVAIRYKTWARNRILIEGEDTVKWFGQTYLPKCSVDQSDDEYAIWADNVPFYPAATRTLELLLGLMFRKAPVLVASPAVDELVNEAVTRDGLTLPQFCYRATRETLITNFTGVLVDHPSAADLTGLSKGNAVEQGFRPYLCIYIAENILEATRAETAGKTKFIRVRLMDPDETVRELVLEDGIYKQYIHSSDNNGNLSTEVITPLVDGKPLTEIPFFLLSADLDFDYGPTPAIMDPTVNLNLQHYKISGRLALAHMFLSSPIPYVLGATIPKDKPLKVSPGSLWSFDKVEVKVGYLEFAGAGVESIERQRNKLEEHLATVGARILASQPNVAESADTHRIKRVSESSALATTARTIAGQVKKALVVFAEWFDHSGSELDLSFNTDFLPPTMTSKDMEAMLKLYQGGLMSWETAFLGLRDGEVVDSTLTPDAELQRIQAGPPPAVPNPEHGSPSANSSGPPAANSSG